MKTLYVFCEGATEQGFCNQVLAPHLYECGFTHIPTIKVATGRKKGVTYRGGVASYNSLKKDIVNTLKSRKDFNVFFTSMLDLYSLPKDFPGKSDNQRNAAHPRIYVDALENAFYEDIGDRRFISHLQLHEYETLLFVHLDALEIAFENCEKAISELKEIAVSFPSIEHINDGTDTAPSKRIISVLPQYEGRKPSAGPDIVEYVGLEIIREKCPHFNDWLIRLENLEK